MGAIEWTKDMVGVMDDVGDFADKTAKEMKKLKPFMLRLELAGDDLVKKLELAEAEGDIKKVKRLLDSSNFDRPKLIGKTLTSKLAGILSSLSRMRSKAGKLEPSIRGRAKSLIDDAEKAVMIVMRDNSELIKQVSSSQREVRAASRRTASLIAGGAVASAVAVGLYGRPMRSAFRDAFHSFERTLQSATRGLMGGIHVLRNEVVLGHEEAQRRAMDAERERYRLQRESDEWFAARRELARQNELDNPRRR